MVEEMEHCPIIEEDLEADFLQGVDLRSCECKKILQSVFPELIRHWRAAGNVKKTLQFLYDAASACLDAKDTIEVRKVKK